MLLQGQATWFEYLMLLEKIQRKYNLALKFITCSNASKLRSQLAAEYEQYIQIFHIFVSKS